MPQEKLNSGDLLLLFLYSKGTGLDVNEPISGKTRLVKMAFLFEKEIYKNFVQDKVLIDEKDLPEFFPWNFGPMSRDVLQDLEFFIDIGFVESIEEKDTFAYEEAEEFSSLDKEELLQEPEDLENEFVNYKYLLTKLGEEYIQEKIIPSLSENQIKILQELKRRLNGAPLIKILKYVYETYPDSAKKSKIATKVASA